jgi:hypothetical protein
MTTLNWDLELHPRRIIDQRIHYAYLRHVYRHLLKSIEGIVYWRIVNLYVTSHKDNAYFYYNIINNVRQLFWKNTLFMVYSILFGVSF